jgi:hypothetical protein
MPKKAKGRELLESAEAYVSKAKTAEDGDSRLKIFDFFRNNDLSATTPSGGGMQ